MFLTLSTLRLVSHLVGPQSDIIIYRYKLKWYRYRIWLHTCAQYRYYDSDRSEMTDKKRSWNHCSHEANLLDPRQIIFGNMINIGLASEKTSLQTDIPICENMTFGRRIPVPTVLVYQWYHQYWICTKFKAHKMCFK